MASDSEGSSDIARPTVGSKKPSSNIVPRDSQTIELKDEVFSPSDIRCMSPRRNSEDVERMGQESRRVVEEYAHSNIFTPSATI